MKRYELTGATVIVTGASSGIGRAVAEKLIKRHGCKVIGVGRSEEKFRACLQNLGEGRERFSYRLFDVGEKEKWAEFAAFLRETAAQPDLVINCAGMLPAFSAYGEDSDAEKVLRTNFLSAVFSLETLSPLLHSSTRPKIVNVASSSALCPFAGVAAYCASKAALVKFSECVALERGIPCAVILPGFTDTDVFRFQSFDEKSDSFFKKFSMSADRMSDKIIKAIRGGTRRKVIGADARLMELGYKLFPRLTPLLITKILKSVKSEAFQSITK